MKISGILLGVCIFTTIVIAQNNRVVEINTLQPGDLRVAGFTLQSEKTVHIEGEGAGDKRWSEKVHNMMDDPNRMFAYAWILNAKNRKMVWRMTLNNTEQNPQTRYNRKYEGNLSLSAGEYEIYYSAIKPEYRLLDDGFFSLGKLLNKLLRGEDYYYETTDREKWFLRISGVDEVVERGSVDKFHKALSEQAVVSIIGLRDSDFKKEGFNLKKQGAFQIYAIGESFRGEAYDYGWIVDAGNSEKVWESLPEKSEYAGGAIKNRMWRETLTLEPGAYWVYYVMDDSHSPQHWNANPPYDPDFYGITLTGVQGKYDPNSVEKLLKLQIKPIVELTRLGDNEFVQEGFKIAQPIQIRVYALGEGRDGEMYDYGWIVNLDSGDKVWEMNYNRTRHAGGAEKNRLIDEVIHLQAGSYMVYYMTDGSHSYLDWNASKPYNPTSWGITIYPADPKYSGEPIQKLESAPREKNVIAQIIRVKDGRYIQERFTLDRETRIRIYAIGEGDWDEMYDYGWIEEVATGEKSWRMTYDETRWAGGASKNRKVDRIITLPPGQYLLHYHTDGSHSFNDWNDDPPDDPLHYGISLYNEGEEK